MHRSLYVSMAHCPHDHGQVPGSHKDSSAVVMAGTIKDQFLREAGLLPSLSKQAIRLSIGDPQQNAWKETPSLPPLCHTVYARAPGRDGSSEQVVFLPEFCCPARRSCDFPNRDFRCARGRVPFGFSSRYPASRSRCHERVHAFADATCRPRLPLVISFPLHRQAEDAAHAPSSS